MGKPFLQRLHAKEYAGSWKNPLFENPKVRDRFQERLRYVFYSMLLCSALITCVAVLFWFATQEKFAVTTVRIEGMRSVPNEKLAQEALHYLATCTALFAPCLYTWNIPEQDIRTLLKNTYAAELVATTYKTGIWDIQLHEAVTLIPLRIGSAIWFASPGGVLQKESTPEERTEGVLIPPEVYCEIDVTAVMKKNPTAGDQIDTPETFASLATYQKAFKEKGIPITELILTKDPGKIIATTAQGFSVFFTPWEPASVQVQRLVDVLQKTTPQSYGDIRFGERIYIK